MKIILRESIYNQKLPSQIINGFTLIELILYMAIVSIFMSGAILFAWDIIYGRVKSTVQEEVSQNLRYASKRLQYEIRNASDINSVSASAISLASNDPNRNPTTFGIETGQLWIGYGTTGPCSISTPCAITSNNVNVSNLTFTNLTSGGTNSKNIKFSITIESVADRKEWQMNDTYESSTEIRSNPPTPTPTPVGPTSTPASIPNPCPTQADCLNIDTSSANIAGGGDRDLQGLLIQRTDVQTITVTTMTVSWTEPGRTMQNIRIDGSNLWTGNVSSGTLVDITDYVPDTVNKNINRLRFFGDMSGSSFTLQFTMGDGSTKSVIITSPPDG